MAVNTGKVIAGGLVAGLVANVCDFIAFGVVMKDKMAAEMNALNPALAEKAAGMHAMVGNITFDFVIGIMLVWLYASIRGTYGPGPRTALRAGVFMWLLFSGIYATMALGGMFSWSFYFTAAALGLVNLGLASLAGGAVYKE